LLEGERASERDRERERERAQERERGKETARERECVCDSCMPSVGPDEASPPGRHTVSAERVKVKSFRMIDWLREIQRKRDSARTRER